MKYKLPGDVLAKYYLSYVRLIMEYGSSMFVVRNSKDPVIFDEIDLDAMRKINRC